MPRYSFENDDDASIRPHDPLQPQGHFHSNRGQGGYSVSSGAAYLPPHEPPSSPGPELHYGGVGPYSAPMDHGIAPVHLHQGRVDHAQMGQRTLLDSSPQSARHLDTASAAPPPPPPPHLTMDNHGPPSAAVGIVPGGIMRSPGDTSHLTAHGQDSGNISNPFQDEASDDSLTHPSHGYSGSHTKTSNPDPFTQRHVAPAAASTAAIGIPGANSYEMRPPINQRPSSYTDPYGHSWRNESQGDLGSFDPRDIADDEDDMYVAKSRKAPIVGSSNVAVAGGGLLGSRDASGRYGQIPGGDHEKSARLKSQGSSGRRTMWMVGSAIGFIIIIAIIGGVVGGVLYSNNAKKSNPSSGTEDDNGPDLDKDSASIKSLLNNPNLHRIFPGMDYNPFNGQYPGCLTWPPSQNNVTKDVAVLSQLTPKIRLYGTDCNQTEMVLHAIDKLDMKDSVKVWLGVYLDSNQTTNDRQLSQMWKILDDHGPDPFAGLIVGNEVLFSEYMSENQLIDLLDNVRQNLTSKGITFPLATSDLGSNWKPYPNLVQAVDIVMGNVHPFFGGVEAAKAASWTNTYFEDNDVSAARAASSDKKALVAEVGWPSSGGNLCTNAVTGKNVTCSSPAAGAVAGTSEMNKFLEDWACPALEAGTEYFWFEAFDEPWKERFNYDGAEWETEWGLMDIDRKMKPGLKIPDCGGRIL